MTLQEYLKSHPSDLKKDIPIEEEGKPIQRLKAEIFMVYYVRDNEQGRVFIRPMQSMKREEVK